MSKGTAGLDYLIVLGAGVYGEEPSPALRSRTETAIRYLEENPGAKAVLSGGQGPGEAITEAECMARLMEAEGIAPYRLVKEEHSTTTAENIKNSYELIGGTDKMCIRDRSVTLDRVSGRCRPSGRADAP